MDDYIEVNHNTSLELSDLSVTFWVKTPNSGLGIKSLIAKENFNNTLDKEVRIEIYKLEDRKFIDKNIEHANRHYYKLNKLGLEFINRKTGCR